MADRGSTPPDDPPVAAPDLPADVDPATADIATVSQLSQELSAAVDTTDGLHHDYVLGDVANPSTASSGHLYFTLEGEDCELQCVAFSFRQTRLSTEPDDGMRVLVEGDLEYYAPRGQVSLQVTDCHEVGQGAYAQVYEQTRQRLEADGLLADEHKQPLPGLPEHVGLVTSKHGDAVADATESIHSRYPDIDITVANASVQGDDAVETIVTNVARLDEDPDVDLIVVTRGGGSDSALRTFNELAVCRTVARTETPVAVGIGHESDETLAGRVADERIITPTDAGRLVPDRASLEQHIETLDARLEGAYRTRVETRLGSLATRHEQAYDRAVTDELRGLRHDVETAAARTIQGRLSALTADLDTAYVASEQRLVHQQELHALRRRYRLVVAGLVSLLLAALVATFVF